MLKKIASVIILLALCIPALAADMHNMVGNWTGTISGVSYLKNTDYQTTGKPEYWEDKYTITIDEQNGTRFSGKIVRNVNPLAKEVVLGVIGSDNKTLTMADENSYLWGWLNSPTEMELFWYGTNMDSIGVWGGNFTKG